MRDLLATSSNDFDLAISFSPLSGGDSFLSDLIALREHNIPFYFTSFSSTHALLNHAILRAHNAEAESVVSRNPFALVSKRHGENWNRVISKVPVEALPVRGSALDEDYFAALGVTATMVLNSHHHGDPSQYWPVGSFIDDQWVHTLDGIAVSTDSGDVYDANAKQSIGRLDPQWLEHVAKFDPSWDETDRLIWSAHVRYFAVSDGIAGMDHGSQAHA